MEANKKRLEYLRQQLRLQQMSYGELFELQSLAKYIDSNDVELLEAAGVPEFKETITVKIEKTLEFTNQDINDLLVTAFEGGINYWCGKVKIKSIPDDSDVQYASDVISVGGTLELIDIEDPNEKWELTLEKMIKGIKLYCEKNGCTDADDMMDNHDADTADAIVQYALFDEVVFG